MMEFMNNDDDSMAYGSLSSVNSYDEKQDLAQLTDQQKKLKSLYEELADKEQALIMAAQFGNKLIEEKESLERQMESNKQEHLVLIEKLEQDSYELKRQLESTRNEYETKLYELTDDCNKYKQELIQNDQNRSSRQQNQNEQIYLIEELTAKNESLIEELKASELKHTAEFEKNIALELKIQEKEHVQSENTKLLQSFQKEINMLLNKQHDLEFSLMQACNERDKQAKFVEELTKKYLFVENEKNEIEHLLFQHENEIFNLRRVNQDLIYKLEKIELHSNALNLKRRSVNDTNKDPNNIANNTNKNSKNNNSAQINHFYEHEDSFDENSSTSSPYRPFKNSNFYNSRSELNESDNDLDVFKMNEIEEDDDCDEDGDESVDMFKNAAFMNTHSSDQFLSGAINWQQEAIEEKLHEETDNEHENSQESQSLNDDLSNQNDNSDYILNQNHEEVSQSPFSRNIEEDSNNSLN